MRVQLIRDKSFYRRVMMYMLPVALQQAINMGVNMLDTMMLGSFGEIQLSASSLANQFYNFFTIFCTFVYPDVFLSTGTFKRR